LKLWEWTLSVTVVTIRHIL